MGKLTKMKTILEGMRQQNIHSRIDFQIILEDERTRSDRTGCEFSVITFEASNSKPDNSSIRCLNKILNRRTRSCDEIGLIDENRLCVILPETPTDGAQILADNICKAINSEKIHLKYTVCSYQSGWINGNKEVLDGFLGTDFTSELNEGSVDNNINLSHQPRSFLPLHIPLRKRVNRVALLTLILLPPFLMFAIFLLR